MNPKLIGSVFLLLAFAGFSKETPGLADKTLLIIRHAEKPEAGAELSPAGAARAKAYISYFKGLAPDGPTLKIDHIFATADSKNSHRPRLTVEPLSKSTGVAVDARFKNKAFEELAELLRRAAPGTNILICWHHGEIPNLLTALNADPETVLPHGNWPDKVFNWVIELQYDAKGRLVQSKRIEEHLMPSDDVSPK